MSKFAPVCPVNLLKSMSPYASGDYHLLLAHDVAAKGKDYRGFANAFHNMTVIMDNSVIELGNAVDLKLILKACTEVDTTTVVLPDVLLDGKATVESCKAALETWTPAFKPLWGDSLGPNRRRGFMYVPQGNTLKEFAASAEALADHPDINFWGVPRNLVAKVGTRSKAIDIVYALNHHRRIHLLGFSDDIVDDVVVSQDRRVEGIDSAVPIRAASLGERMRMDLDLPPRDPNWFDTAEFVPLMDENIEIYRRWIRRK